MEQLTVDEKAIIAFALFGMCMRSGPKFFPLCGVIVAKIGIEKEFQECAQDWIDYAKTRIGRITGYQEKM
jgi:hypothetical protein